MATQIRQGNKRFYDELRFKRGFQKSGDFTIAEADILTLYGRTLDGLEKEELTPQNEDERRFVQVAHHQLQPESLLEKVWCKYVRLARGRVAFHALTSKGKTTESEEDYTDEPLIEDEG